MAKLIVSDGVNFNPDFFYQQLQQFNSSTTVSSEPYLWRVEFDSDGVASVRGDNFVYETNSPGVQDNELTEGDIVRFSFNAEGTSGDPGPALVKIRGLDNLSGALVHDAIQAGTPEAAIAVLKEAFKHNDVLNGANQGDDLAGFSGDDKIVGNDGSDYLDGGRGHDRLEAGIGSDTLDGGKGKDGLFGGADADQDVFFFENGDSGKQASSADRIHDFTIGTDVIDLSELGAEKSDIHVDRHDGNSYITIDAHDGHDKMVIIVVDNNNVHRSDLSYSDL